MAQYLTEAGDTWDKIAYEQYGDETYMTALIEANPMYVGTFVFDADIILEIPTIAEEEDTMGLPEWRTLTDDDLDAEEVGSVDYYSDEESEDDESGDYPEEDEGDE